MNRNSILAYIAAILFLVAAILSFIDGSNFRGIIGTIGAISFFLTAIHWGKKSRLNK